ncbi:hypothetical protein XENOCAPTIV_000608 [Xenoophorus captivus]|uniref:Uncharacterized protein n=1 Tax=Xenoophorus captivus TaxID=1517983 RepID=A0ABV0S550_9TELE
MIKQGGNNAAHTILIAAVLSFYRQVRQQCLILVVHQEGDGVEVIAGGLQGQTVQSHEASHSLAVCPTSLPEFDLGPPSTPDSLQREINSDRGCSPKKRRLMPETEVDMKCRALSAKQVVRAPPQPCSATQTLTLPQPSSVLSRPEMESSCMEIEAAHRKLQEIEDRYGATFCLLVRV